MRIIRRILKPKKNPKKVGLISISAYPNSGLAKYLIEERGGKRDGNLKIAKTKKEAIKISNEYRKKYGLNPKFNMKSKI